MEWRNPFGDIYWAYGRCGRQTTDGGYVIGGEIRSTIYDYNAYLVKTDELGNEIWWKKFGKNPEIDKGTCVLQSTDGGYILVG